MGCKYGGSVKGCDELKHWVKVINKSAPWLPHRESYKKQCRTCGNYGTMTSQKPIDEMVLPEEQAEIFKKEKQLEVERYLEERRQALEREREEETRQWHEQYEAYLKSPVWQHKRKLVLERDRYICQSCLTQQATEVHHLSYQGYNENPGHEPAWQLISVCRQCHELQHS